MIAQCQFDVLMKKPLVSLKSHLRQSCQSDRKMSYGTSFGTIYCYQSRVQSGICVSPKKFPAMFDEADEAIRRRHAYPRVVNY